MKVVENTIKNKQIRGKQTSEEEVIADKLFQSDRASWYGPLNIVMVQKRTFLMFHIFLNIFKRALIK